MVAAQVRHILHSRNLCCEPKWFLVRLLAAFLFSVLCLFLAPALLKTTDALGLFSASVLSSPAKEKHFSLLYKQTFLSALSKYFSTLFFSLLSGLSGHDSVLDPGRCSDVNKCLYIRLYLGPSACPSPAVPLFLLSPFLSFSACLLSFPSSFLFSQQTEEISSSCSWNIVWVPIWRTPRSEGRKSSREREWEEAQKNLRKRGCLCLSLCDSPSVVSSSITNKMIDMKNTWRCEKEKRG